MHIKYPLDSCHLKIMLIRWWAFNFGQTDI